MEGIMENYLKRTKKRWESLYQEACRNQIEGKLVQAKRNFHEAIDLAEEIYRETKAVEDYNNLAVSYGGFAMTGGTAALKGFEALQKAFTILEKLERSTKDDTFRMRRETMVEEYITMQAESPQLPFLGQDPNKLSEITQVLGNYDILENDDHEILFVLNRKLPGENKEPVLYYDGGEHGVLRKNDEGLFICDYIHPQVRESVYACNEILILEYKDSRDDSIEYMAKAVHAKGTSEFASKFIK